MSPNGAEPETITPVIDPPKKKRTKRTPKGNAFLNPLAATLADPNRVDDSISITDAVVICTESDYDSVTIDQVDNIKALLRDDHRFIVFLQGATDRVKLMPVEKKPDMFDRIEADMAPGGAFDDTKAAEGDTKPPEPGTNAPSGETTPTIGETLAASGDTKVMETIAKPMTPEERAQFELHCHMKHRESIERLGIMYLDLKGQQSSLQGQLSEVHKNLKETAGRLANLAVTAVDMLYQDGIKFDKPPVDAPVTGEDPGLTDEHGEKVEKIETIKQDAADLSHIDNPGSGTSLSKPAAVAEDDAVPE